MAKRIGKWFTKLRRKTHEDDTAGLGESLTLPQGAPWAAGGTDRGRARENNEDALLCDPDRKLFIVADGMGGQEAGEQASASGVGRLGEALAGERLAAALSGEAPLEPLLRAALLAANDAVTGLVREHPEWHGMASTVVVGLLAQGRFHVGNLGDSRAYLIRGGGLQVLTRDDSMAALMVEQGQLSEEEARNHPLRNRVTAFLGMSNPPPPHYLAAPVRADDRIVLCSDGLWDMLPDREIARVAQTHPDPREAVRELIAAANEAGGHDNITVIVIAVRPEEACVDDSLEADTVLA